MDIFISHYAYFIESDVFMFVCGFLTVELCVLCWFFGDIQYVYMWMCVSQQYYYVCACVLCV